MPHLDEGTIHAWLDGALPDEERANVERHVAGCESCAAAVAEARGFVAGATRILSALDDAPSASLPGKGSAGGAAGSRTTGRSLWRTLHFTPARAAAAAVLIVAAGTFLTVNEAKKQGDVATTRAEVEAVATDSAVRGNVAPMPSASTPVPSAPRQPQPPAERPLAGNSESKKVARQAQSAQVAAAAPATTQLSDVVRDSASRRLVMREEVQLSKLAVSAPVAVDSTSLKSRGVASNQASAAASVVGCYAVATTNLDKDSGTLPSLISLDSASQFAEMVRTDETSARDRERRSFTRPAAQAPARAPANAGARAPAAAPAPAPVAAAADAAVGRMDSIARGERLRAVSILSQPDAAGTSKSESTMRGYWTPVADGSVFVRLPSSAGTPPRTLVLRAEPNGLAGVLQESGRSMPVSLRRVSCR